MLEYWCVRSQGQYHTPIDTDVMTQASYSIFDPNPIIGGAGELSHLPPNLWPGIGEWSWIAESAEVGSWIAGPLDNHIVGQLNCKM